MPQTDADRLNSIFGARPSGTKVGEGKAVRDNYVSPFTKQKQQPSTFQPKSSTEALGFAAARQAELQGLHDRVQPFAAMGQTDPAYRSAITASKALADSLARTERFKVSVLEFKQRKADRAQNLADLESGAIPDEVNEEEEQGFLGNAWDGLMDTLQFGVDVVNSGLYLGGTGIGALVDLAQGGLGSIGDDAFSDTQGYADFYNRMDKFSEVWDASFGKSQTVGESFHTFAEGTRSAVRDSYDSILTLSDHEGAGLGWDVARYVSGADAAYNWAGAFSHVMAYNYDLTEEERTALQRKLAPEMAVMGQEMAADPLNFLGTPITKVAKIRHAAKIAQGGRKAVTRLAAVKKALAGEDEMAAAFRMLENAGDLDNVRKGEKGVQIALSELKNGADEFVFTAEDASVIAASFDKVSKNAAKGVERMNANKYAGILRDATEAGYIPKLADTTAALKKVKESRKALKAAKEAGKKKSEIVKLRTTLKEAKAAAAATKAGFKQGKAQLEAAEKIGKVSDQWGAHLLGKGILERAQRDQLRLKGLWVQDVWQTSKSGGSQTLTNELTTIGKGVSYTAKTIKDSKVLEVMNRAFVSAVPVKWQRWWMAAKREGVGDAVEARDATRRMAETITAKMRHAGVEGGSELETKIFDSISDIIENVPESDRSADVFMRHVREDETLRRKLHEIGGHRVLALDIANDFARSSDFILHFQRRKGWEIAEATSDSLFGWWGRRFSEPFRGAAVENAKIRAFLDGQGAKAYDDAMTSLRLPGANQASMRRAREITTTKLENDMRRKFGLPESMKVFENDPRRIIQGDLRYAERAFERSRLIEAFTENVAKKAGMAPSEVGHMLDTHDAKLLGKFQEKEARAAKQAERAAQRVDEFNQAKTIFRQEANAANTQAAAAGRKAGPLTDAKFAGDQLQEGQRLIKTTAEEVFDDLGGPDLDTLLSRDQFVLRADSDIVTRIDKVRAAMRAVANFTKSKNKGAKTLEKTIAALKETAGGDDVAFTVVEELEASLRRMENLKSKNLRTKARDAKQAVEDIPVLPSHGGEKPAKLQAKIKETQKALRTARKVAKTVALERGKEFVASLANDIPDLPNATRRKLGDLLDKAQEAESVGALNKVMKQMREKALGVVTDKKVRETIEHQFQQWSLHAIRFRDGLKKLGSARLGQTLSAQAKRAAKELNELTHTPLEEMGKTRRSYVIEDLAAEAGHLAEEGETSMLKVYRDAGMELPNDSSAIAKLATTFVETKQMSRLTEAMPGIKNNLLGDSTGAKVLGAMGKFMETTKVFYQRQVLARVPGLAKDLIGTSSFYWVNAQDATASFADMTKLVEKIDWKTGEVVWANNPVLDDLMAAGAVHGRTAIEARTAAPNIGNPLTDSGAVGQAVGNVGKNLFNRGIIGAPAQVFHDAVKRVAPGTDGVAGVLNKVADRAQGVSSKSQAVTDWSINARKTQDEMFRVALYMDRIKSGYSKADAVEEVFKVFGNYQELTSLTDKTLKKFMFFYAWQRKAIPSAVRSYFEHPLRSRMMMVGVAGNVGSEDPEAPDGALRKAGALVGEGIQAVATSTGLSEKIGRPDENNGKPDFDQWLKRLGGFTIGRDKRGNPQVVSLGAGSWYSPLRDITESEILNSMTGESEQTTMEATGQALFKKAHPIIQMAYEKFENVDTFTGLPISDPENTGEGALADKGHATIAWLSDKLKVLGPDVDEWLGLRKTVDEEGNLKSYRMDPESKWFLESPLPGVGAVISDVDPFLDERKSWQAGLSRFMGFPVYSQPQRSAHDRLRTKAHKGMDMVKRKVKDLPGRPLRVVNNRVMIDETSEVGRKMSIQIEKAQTEFHTRRLEQEEQAVQQMAQSELARSGVMPTPQEYNKVSGRIRKEIGMSKKQERSANRAIERRVLNGYDKRFAVLTDWAARLQPWTTKEGPSEMQVPEFREGQRDIAAKRNARKFLPGIR